MWGIIPAAGVGSRIQPLAFSKELLPVGGRHDGKTERPRAVGLDIDFRLLDVYDVGALRERFDIVQNPAHEFYVCRRREFTHPSPGAVYPRP